MLCNVDSLMNPIDAIGSKTGCRKPRRTTDRRAAER